MAILEACGIHRIHRIEGTWEVDGLLVLYALTMQIWLEINKINKSNRDADHGRVLTKTVS